MDTRITNLKVTTWNINSVRLRIELMAKFIKAVRPDVICLQKTKCPDDKFPLKRFKRLGYPHAALNGQKGYHGVAVLSRLPLDSFNVRNYCGKSDSRHLAVTIGDRAGLADPVTLHNFYVPAGGDEPDPAINENSPTSSPSWTKCAQPRTCSPGAGTAPSWSATSMSRRWNTMCGVIRSC